MQQRTGIRRQARTAAAPRFPSSITFSICFTSTATTCRRVMLEQRKETARKIVISGDLVRYSDHYRQGIALFEAAKKKRPGRHPRQAPNSCYEERRSREWLKIKITQTVDCVIGGYTDPKAAANISVRSCWAYTTRRQLIHVGQAGTGFDQETLKEISQVLKKRRTNRNPFTARLKPESTLGEAGAGGRNQILPSGLTRPRRRTEAARARVSWACGKTKIQKSVYLDSRIARASERLW